jgi:hypothetical protein
MFDISHDMDRPNYRESPRQKYQTNSERSRFALPEMLLLLAETRSRSIHARAGIPPTRGKAGMALRHARNPGMPDEGAMLQ